MNAATQTFRLSAFISKLLGIGDIQSLIEHVQLLNLQDDESHKKTMENFKGASSYTGRDFQNTNEHLTKMGSLANIALMIPGMSGIMS